MSDDAQGLTSDNVARPTVLGELALRHFRFGWMMLCTFVALGAVLDALHAFKVGFYLDVGAETRRFMWTLAHAHGLGLGLLHIGYGATLRAGVLRAGDRLRRASACLVWAAALIPTGFFLGGIAARGADPSIGVFLVPAGGLVLLAGVVGVTSELGRS